MEDNAPNRRIKVKLNIFDIVIICLAIAAAAAFYFIFSGASAAGVTSQQSTVRYTVQLDSAPDGTADLIDIGDALQENVKKFSIGTVTGVEFSQGTTLTEDHENGCFIDTPVPGYESIRITIEAPAVETDRNITVGGGFVVRVGAPVSVTGPGYAGGGYIVEIERGDG
ncbi:MAG: DUF4330 family protein [Oscillospiraceae bacterium]|nr:DUF4330 family protein [Oscillospiraceae bacterium]